MLHEEHLHTLHLASQVIALRRAILARREIAPRGAIYREPALPLGENG